MNPERDFDFRIYVKLDEFEKDLKLYTGNPDKFEWEIRLIRGIKKKNEEMMELMKKLSEKFDRDIAFEAEDLSGKLNTGLEWLKRVKAQKSGVWTKDDLVDVSWRGKRYCAVIEEVKEKECPREVRIRFLGNHPDFTNWVSIDKLRPCMGGGKIHPACVRAYCRDEYDEDNVPQFALLALEELLV